MVNSKLRRDDLESKMAISELKGANLEPVKTVSGAMSWPGAHRAHDG